MRTRYYDEAIKSAVFVNAGDGLLSAAIKGKSPRKGRYM
jgi:hypothetical protein